MLTINEYPRGKYSLSNSETGEGISELTEDDLDLLRIMLEGVRVAKQKEPEVHPIFQDIINNLGLNKGGK